MRVGMGSWCVGVLAAALVWAGANLYLAPSIEADLATRAAQALGSGAADEPWAKAVARGRDLDLEGEAPSAEDKQRAISALKRVPGVRVIRDAATIAPQPNVYAWRAARTRGRIVLAGLVPAEERAALVEEARRTFPKTDIADQMRVADGAPEGFAAAAALALRELARLPEGEAALDGTKLSLRGAAPDVAAYAAVRAARTELPSAFTLDLAGLAPAPARPFTVRLARDESGVVLTGYAPTEEAARTLARAVGKAFPGVRVSDSLRIAAGFPGNVDYGAAAGFAVAALAELKTGTVTLTDGTVDVHGTAPDRQGVADVDGHMRDRIPAGLRLGKVSVTAAPVGRFRLVARRTVDGLELTGHYPDAHARTALSGTLAELYFERIDDRLRLGDGAPRGFTAAATFALEQLSQLAAGEAEVEGSMIRISGETPYMQLAGFLRERIPRGAPSGWTAAADIKADPPATASLR